MSKNFKGEDTENTITRIISNINETNNKGKEILEIQNNFTDDSVKNTNKKSNLSSSIFESIGVILLGSLGLLASLYVMIFATVLGDAGKKTRKSKKHYYYYRKDKGWY